MHIINDLKLASRLHNDKVGQEEKELYYLVFILLITLPVKYNLFSALIGTTIYHSIVGLIFYFLNRKGDGKNFFTRYFCLTPVIAIRSFLVGLVVSLSTTIALTPLFISGPILYYQSAIYSVAILVYWLRATKDTKLYKKLGISFFFLFPSIGKLCLMNIDNFENEMVLSGSILYGTALGALLLYLIAYYYIRLVKSFRIASGRVPYLPKEPKVSKVKKSEKSLLTNKEST